MILDAVIIGVSIAKDGKTATLHLEQREDRQRYATDVEKLTVEDPPPYIQAIIGTKIRCDDDGLIFVGKKIVAEVLGKEKIRFTKTL